MRWREGEINTIQGESGKRSCRSCLFTRILDIFTRASYERTETEIYKVKSKKGAFIFHIS